MLTPLRCPALTIIGLWSKLNSADFLDMIHGRIQPPVGTRHRDRGPRPLKDHFFAWRVLWGVGAGLTLCCLLLIVPALYLVEQNYDIFQQLAFDIKPSLIQHLEREVVWLRLFMVVGLSGTLLVGALFIYKVSRHLLRPLDDVEDHLRRLTMGDWSEQGPSRLEPEVYRTFFLTYEHFHRTLISGAENELRLLEKLNVDPAQREAHAAWIALRQLYLRRLALPSQENWLTAPDASSSGAGTSRRAS